MDWPRILGSACATLIGAAVMTVVVVAARRPPAVRDGALELSYPLPFKLIIGFCGAVILAFLLLAAGLCIFGERDEELIRILLITVVPLGLLGVAALLEMFVRYQVDADGIRGRTAWRGHRSMRWDDVVAVRYSGAMGWFKFTDRNGEVLRVSRLLRGHELMVRVVAERLSDRVGDKALQDYFNYRKAGF